MRALLGCQWTVVSFIDKKQYKAKTRAAADHERQMQVPHSASLRASLRLAALAPIRLRRAVMLNAAEHLWLFFVISA